MEKGEQAAIQNECRILQKRIAELPQRVSRVQKLLCANPALESAGLVSCLSQENAYTEDLQALRIAMTKTLRFLDSHFLQLSAVKESFRAIREDAEKDLQDLQGCALKADLSRETSISQSIFQVGQIIVSLKERDARLSAQMEEINTAQQALRNALSQTKAASLLLSLKDLSDRLEKLRNESGS